MIAKIVKNDDCKKYYLFFTKNTHIASKITIIGNPITRPISVLG